MEDNTSSARASAGRKPSQSAPWDAMNSQWWPDIAEAITGEWPRSACLMDLRWHASQVRLGRLNRIPSRRRLMARWGWSDHNVRALLRDEAAWVDPHHKSPNVLPTFSQRSPKTEAVSQLQPEAVSHESPNDLPTISTRADLHTYTKTQKHNSPPTPPRGADEGPTSEGASVDNPVEAVENTTTPQQTALLGADTETPKPPAKPAKTDIIAETWAQMEAIRCDALNADPASKRTVKPRKLGQFKRPLSARLDEHSAEEILMVARWLWTSTHRRAQNLRAPGYRYVTMLRPSKFRSYLEMASEGAEVDPFEATGTQRQQPAEAGDDEAWQTVQAALRQWGKRSPRGTHGWTFSDDQREDDRYCAAIKTATRCDDLRTAWAYLHDNCRHPDRGPRLRRGFGYGWRTHRAEVAA